MYNVHSTFTQSWLIWKNIVIMSSVTDEKTSELEWIPQDQATNIQITLDQPLCPNIAIHSELLVMFHFSMI